ncbi:hypothetical protein HanPI659440_Chr09g0321361 [Helianthus annuus]|nr:hypothetical protein HanPI659440_Chr09g0321361 [Helianthus annuus]
MLVDELEEDEIEADAERDQDPMSPKTEQMLENIDYGLETEKAAGEEGDDEEKSSSDSEVDETECWKKVISDKEKQKKRKRSGDDDDDQYIPSPEHVQEVQTPPSSRGRKKPNTRKRVVSPVVQKLKIKMKSKPTSEAQQPPSEPQHPSPLHQSPPEPQPKSPQQKQQSPPEQPVITSPHILQTPPTTQPQVQTTPGFSGFKDFPHIPENIPLDDIGDFSFVE